MTVLWVKVSKEGLGQHGQKDLLLCTCYVLPAGSGPTGLSCDVFQQLLDDVIEFDNTVEDGYISVIAGDMNARIATQDDFVNNNYK